MARQIPRFWERNPNVADAKEPVLAWYRHVMSAWIGANLPR